MRVSDLKVTLEITNMTPSLAVLQVVTPILKGMKSVLFSSAHSLPGWVLSNISEAGSMA